MNPRPRHAAGLGLGVALALSLAACGTQGTTSANADGASKAAAGTTELVVNVTSIFGYTALWQALDLQPEGVHVKYITSTIGAGSSTTTALEAGQIDISDDGDIRPIVYNSSGSSIKAIACTAPNPTNVKYLVRKDEGATSFKDLKGKKVAGPSSTNLELDFTNHVEASGLKTGDVGWVNLAGPNALTALLKGDVDAESLQSPEAEEILGKYPDKIAEVTGITSTVPNRYCLTASAKSIEGKRDAISKFLHLAASASLWATQNPAKAAEVAHKTLPDYSVEALTAAYSTYGKGYVPFDADFLKSTQTFAERLKQAKYYQGDVDVKNVFVTDFNQAISSATPTVPAP